MISSKDEKAGSICNITIPFFKRSYNIILDTKVKKYYFFSCYQVYAEEFL